MKLICLYLTVLTLPAMAMAAPLEPVDPLDYRGGAWSPYLVGGLIGVLSWLTFLLSNKALGASSQYATAAGALGKAIAPRHTTSLKYFRDNPPKFGWGTMLIIGMLIGATAAAITGDEFAPGFLPEMWVDRFGEETFLLRGLTAFAGGIFMAFGARLAGGCTSGHGISGTMQLSVGSWIAATCFFIGGIATAFLLYRL
ncbi:MAG: YeeE/YedE thiosulfate transporter family protein [Verrucomicrobiales bacterium]|nr:YeeE/YedE thiosulfate transporter family protein [Verrucomicrobiales bacterium]